VRAYIANASDGAGDACKIAEALQCSDGIVQDGGGVAALRYVGNRGRSRPARLALERTLVTHRDIARDFLREEENGKVSCNADRRLRSGDKGRSGMRNEQRPHVCTACH
jgi:hypothetical protein